MPTATLDITPDIAALGPHHTPQVCYVLVTVGSAAQAKEQHINWAFVADASRSMRIPIVDEAQFRVLIRSGGAQETLVDGVPVWQLAAPLPPAMRAATKSPLDHVARALHAILERLDNADRFALIACAESAEVLNGSAPGDGRADLAHGIDRLITLRLGDETDLALGMEQALEQLRHGRSPLRIDRMLLLTDGFTRQPERCVALAKAAAAERVAISTIGLGGEFQEDLLATLADVSGGSALFVRSVDEITQAVAGELRLARGAVRSMRLQIAPLNGTALRRITSLRPTLAILHEGAAEQSVAVHVGSATGESTLLLELLVPAEIESRAPVIEIALASEDVPFVTRTLTTRRYKQPPVLPAALRDAAARATVARLHKRALDAVGARQHAEAARLLQHAAQRLDELGAPSLAQRYRDEASALEQPHVVQASQMKELAYATRRLSISE